MVAGALEVQFLTNMAKFTAEVTQMNRLVGGVARDMNSALSTVKTMFGALTAGLSVAALVAFSKHTIDSIARMKDLGQEAGTTAAAISRFDEPARKAGLSLDSVASAIFRMSKAASEAKDPSSEAAQALKAIGISSAQLKGLKPDEMFELVARSVAKYSDGLEKNHLMQVLFNKSGKEMNKVVAEIAETGKLVATVTNEEAEAADRFNDMMVELKMNSEKGWRSLASEFLPALNDIVKAFIEARKEGGLLDAVVKSLAVTFGLIAGTETLPQQLQKVNQEIEEQTRLWNNLQQSRQGILGFTGASIADIARVDDALKKLYQARANILKLVAEPTGNAFAGGKAEADKLTLHFDPKAAAAALAAAKKYWEDFRKLEGEEEMRVLKEQEEFVKAYNENMAKLRHDAQQAEVDDINARGDVLDALKDHIEALKQENAQIGMTDLARKLYILNLQKEKALKNADEADVAQITRYYDELVALTKLGDARAESLGIWSQMASAAGDFFSDLVMNGKSAFDNLKRWVKELLAQMIKIFATRWILQMGATAAGGGGAGSALASQATSYGSDTLGGMALSAGSAYLFGTGATAVGTGAAAGSVFAGGVASGTVTTAGVVGSGGAMAGVYSALSAIPVWGWIAMAVIAAIAFFSGRGGGPKVEGSSVGSFDATGNPLGAYRVSDEYGNRFLRGTQMDSALDPLRTATGDSYRNLVSRLGGTFGTAGFGFGASNDPAGDARSRVFGSAMVNGRNVFDGIMDVDDKEVDAALMLTSKRAILAALQATDFDDEIDKIFAGAGDVAKLTGEQIDAIIAQAREMYGVIQGLGQLSLGLNVESLRFFATEGESIGQTFQRVAGAWLQLEDAFTTPETKLANASAQLLDLEQALNKVGIQMPVTREGWLDVMRALSRGDEAALSLFGTMMNLAPAFDVVRAAADALAVEIQGLDKLRFLHAGGSEQGFLIQQLLGRNPSLAAGTAGMSEAEFIRNLWTISNTDYARYSADDRRIIDAILGADLHNTTAINELGQTIGPSLSGKSPEEEAFERYYRTAGARKSLGDYLGNSLLGDKSPLDPREKLAEAQKQFEAMLTLAKGGDLAALQGLGGARDAYLDLARQMFGSSSPFIEIFQKTFDQVAGVAGVADYNTRMIEIQTRSVGFQESIASDMRSVRDLLQRIADAPSTTIASRTAEAERR